MFILIDKPTGFTSFDLIRKLKKLFPRKTKIGHAGTLDPMATGLMIIATHRDTKALHGLTGLDKEYIATIDFSKKSDTWDMDYREYFEELEFETGVLSVANPSTSQAQPLPLSGETNHVKVPTKEDIHALLTSKLGTSRRPLTPFSAKKVAGKKLYEYAREGNPIYMDVDMELIDFEIIRYEFPILEIRLHVGSGTYIRSIAHWIGEQFGLGGILTALRRTKVGQWRL